MFQVKFKSSADKRFSKLPIDVQRRIVSKLEFFLQQEDPLYFAEVLTDPRIGRFRFRIGDYRVVFDIVEENTIIILDIDHRKNIYR